jgi:hypothetical protein
VPKAMVEWMGRSMLKGRGCCKVVVSDVVAMGNGRVRRTKSGCQTVVSLLQEKSESLQ